jgi:two-component system sensor histidine kinase DesK
VTTVAITLLACGVEAARGEWATVTAVPGVALWGFATIILRRLVVTVDELRAAREELARLAVADERLRFARDLHDLLGHSLSLITLKSELAGRLLQSDRDRAAAEVADIERVARQALREVREAVTGYRRLSLASELDGVRAVLTAAGVDTRIENTAGALPTAVDETIAWGVREGATNVIRHSGARRCDIRVTRENGEVRAEVTDDGHGAPAGALPDETGSGLRGLAERVTALDGEMAAGPNPAGGYRLQIVLPVDDSKPSGGRAAGA